MAGGVSAADMNSAEVQAALNFGVKAVNGMENSMYLRKVQGSYTVTKQVSEQGPKRSFLFAPIRCEYVYNHTILFSLPLKKKNSRYKAITI